MNRPLAAQLSSFLLVACAIAGGAPPAFAQWQATAVSASATVQLTAVKPSSVSVSVRQVPLSFYFDPESDSTPLSVPIRTTWNVNPREVRGLEVVAYFRDPERALISEHFDTIAARYVLGKVDSGHFRPFIESTQAGGSASLTLLSVVVEPGRTRGSRERVLEVRLDTDRLQNQAKAHYSGTVLIEARYY